MSDILRLSSDTLFFISFIIIYGPCIMVGFN